MRVTNFFAGEGTWVQPWIDRGHTVWRTDITAFPGVDVVADILDLPLSSVPQTDVVLASPDCTAFSVASLGTHWGGGHRGYIPKTSKAHNRMGLVHQTVAFIEALVGRDGVQVGVVENPRGMLRKLQILDRYERRSVTYCRYGDTRMKPTDLWGVPAFPEDWVAREMCHNGNPDHEAAPRGAKTGTQGLSKQARSHMPYALSLEVCLAAEQHLSTLGYRPGPVICSPQGFAYYRSLVPAERSHFITPYTPEQIKEEGRPYLFTGGWKGKDAVGFLLKNDGEIANLFHVGRVWTGAGEWALEYAMSLGGNRVEYFDEPHLTDLYRRHGFREVERYPFDLDIDRKSVV